MRRLTVYHCVHAAVDQRCDSLVQRIQGHKLGRSGEAAAVRVCRAGMGSACAERHGLVRSGVCVSSTACMHHMSSMRPKQRRAEPTGCAQQAVPARSSSRSGADLKVVPCLFGHRLNQERFKACTKQPCPVGAAPPAGCRGTRGRCMHAGPSVCTSSRATSLRAGATPNLPALSNHPPVGFPSSQPLIGTRGSAPNPTRSVALPAAGSSSSRRAAAGQAPPASSSSTSAAPIPCMALQVRAAHRQTWGCSGGFAAHAG